MKKFLLRIALFFGIVIVFDIGYGLLCDDLLSHAKGGNMKSVDVSAKKQTADVVIMGSSRAHHHYVPAVIERTLGLTSHNAGVDGNGIVLATGLYDMMVKRYTPKIIIYDVTSTFDINVYSQDGNNTRYLGWLRPYFNDPNIREILIRVSSTERYKNFSTMFRYNSKFVDLVKDQFIIGDFTSDGYAPLNGKMKVEPEKNHDKEKTASIDTLKLNMIEDFITNVIKTDCKLVFVVSPKYGVRSSSNFNPIKDLCERYGVEFWDYYADPQFQKLDYFNEPMHLNHQGAQLFSEVISKRLTQGLLQ